MARFSVGRDDDGEGSSSPTPWPKRQRPATTRPSTTTTTTRSTTTTTTLPNYWITHGLFTCGADVVLEQEEADEEDEEIDGDRYDNLFFGDEVDSDHREAEEEEDEDDQEEEEQEEEEHGAEDDRDPDEIRNLSSRFESTASCGKRKERDLVGSSGSGSVGSISVILTDPDIFDCPICFDPLSTPVFQCENGHIACSSCCTKVVNKCPSCSWPIGYNRCRALEKVLESVKISCQNVKYGCKEIVSYSKKQEHEETCPYAPCLCPFSDCDYSGTVKNLSLHVPRNHPNSTLQFSYNCLFPLVLEQNQKHLILQEKSDGRIFVLNHSVEYLGNVANIICIGPGSSKKEFSYDLVATNGDSSVRLQSFTHSISRWKEGVSERGFLVVPNDFLGPSGQLKLNACIRKHNC